MNGIPRIISCTFSTSSHSVNTKLAFIYFNIEHVGQIKNRIESPKYSSKQQWFIFLFTDKPIPQNQFLYDRYRLTALVSGGKLFNRCTLFLSHHLPTFATFPSLYLLSVIYVFACDDCVFLTPQWLIASLYRNVSITYKYISSD
jgi:hypothetical protein